MSVSSEIQDRVAFTCITDETRAVLAEFIPVLRKELPGILEDFYAHVRRFPHLAAMFGSDANMNRAAKAQENHWLKLFSARFDDEYVASVRTIGRTHSRIGLEPRWYIGGYTFIFRRLCLLASHAYSSRLRPAVAQDKAGQLMAALSQVVMVDMDLAISIYLEENKAGFDRRLHEITAAFQQNITPVVDGLGEQADDLSGAANAMTRAAELSAAQAQVVMTAATDSSTNVQTVATATEELHSSVREISRQVANSASITESAVEATEDASATMTALSEAAERIGEVTRMISEIASQTNLLALNATIEAARAAESGRGFAVVASEVKSLARETASATESISAQIQAMQAQTAAAVDKIRLIGDRVQRMASVATAIATAVEQQESATQEISRSIHDTARGTQDVTDNIVGVQEAADEATKVAVTVQQVSGTLQSRSVDLRRNVEDLLRELRAAA